LDSAGGGNPESVASEDDREAVIRAAAEHVDRLRRRLADGRAELERQNESVEDTRQHIEDISRFIAEIERHLLEVRREASDGEERR
jgi:chromosome segregation ATPase